MGSTNHRDEPHQALKTLILSHSSILSPASTKNPMALFFYRRLCRCYTLMTFTPGVKCLPLLPHLCGIYPTPISHSTNRQIVVLPKNPYFSVRRNRIRAALKAVPAHATRPYLIRSALYQTAKSGCHGKMITAFPHFQLLRMLPCHQTYTVLFQSSSKPVQ